MNDSAPRGTSARPRRFRLGPASSEPTPRRTAVPVAVYVLAGIGFLMGTSEMVVAGLLPQVADSIGEPLPVAGGLISVFALGVVIGAPLSPLLVSLGSQRFVLAVTLSVFAAAHVLMAVAGGFEMTVVARFVSGLTNGVYWGVANGVVVGLVSRAAVARALGILITGNTIAPLVGVPLGTAVGIAVGWPVVFVALGAAAAITAAAVALVVPRTPAGMEHGTRLLRSGLRALKRPRLWLVFLAMALIQSGMAACYSFLPSLVMSFELPDISLTIVQVSFGVGALGGVLVGGALGDRWPWSLLLISTTLLSAACVAVWLLELGTAGLAVLIGAIGLFTLSCNPVLMAEVARAAMPRREVAVALNPAAFNIGNAMGAFLASLSLAITANVSSVAAVGAGLAACAIIPLLVLTASRRDAEHVAQD